jgi:hypothetical protein
LAFTTRTGSYGDRREKENAEWFPTIMTLTFLRGFHTPWTFNSGSCAISRRPMVPPSASSAHKPFSYSSWTRRRIFSCDASRAATNDAGEGAGEGDGGGVSEGRDARRMRSDDDIATRRVPIEISRETTGTNERTDAGPAVDATRTVELIPSASASFCVSRFLFLFAIPMRGVRVARWREGRTDRRASRVIEEKEEREVYFLAGVFR